MSRLLIVEDEEHLAEGFGSISTRKATTWSSSATARKRSPP